MRCVSARAGTCATPAAQESPADAEFSQRLSGWGSTSSDATDAIRTGAKYNFSKLNYQVGRLQQLGGPFSLLGSVQGQWTNDRLPSSERFALGGEVILRAFDAGDLIGDRGYAGKLELRYEPALIPGGQIAFYGYAEYGRTTSLEIAPVPNTVMEGISSGIGVRGTLPATTGISMPRCRCRRSGIRPPPTAARRDSLQGFRTSSERFPMKKRISSPVAEPTRGGRPRNTGFRLSPVSRSVSAAIAGLALCGIGHANPVGGTVVGGQATIAEPAAGQMRVTQSSSRAIVDWRSFSIGAGEAVRFVQPSSSSAILNRVTGNDPSSILGTMSANGHVFLVNQNGVYIGRDAKVDVGGLVLSTANITNGNFMAGRLNFDQPGKPGARIVNDGTVTAAQGGLVAMVAPGVENHGVISAKLGQVVLAGAKTYSLDFYGDGLMNIVVKPSELAAFHDAAGTPLSNYVDSSGQITAEGGRVWITAATAHGIVDSVNVSGGIRASDVSLLAGDRLTIGGTVDATGASTRWADRGQRRERDACVRRAARCERGHAGRFGAGRWQLSRRESRAGRGRSTRAS